MRFPRLLTLLAFIALLLSACAPGQVLGPTITPSATRRSTRTPVPTATQTVTPTLRPTATPTRTPDPTRVTPTLPPAAAGPFESIEALDWAPGGILTNLLPDSQGQLWLTAQRGAARLNPETSTFQQIKFWGPPTLLGLQDDPEQPRLWFIRYSGDAALSWDGTALTEYGREQGWVSFAQPVQRPLRESFAVSPSGQIWISTALDVRRFDGERWRVFNAIELNLPYLRKAGVSVSFTAGLLGESAYAGSCYWTENPDGSRLPIGGGGLTRFDGQLWADAGLPEAGCVTAIQQDGYGNLWVGMDGVLWRYDPLAGAWDDFPPPDMEPHQRPGQVRDLTVDPQGDLWPLYVLCDRIDCEDGELRYHLLDGGQTWQEVARFERLDSHELLFSGDGLAWLVREDDILRPDENGRLGVVSSLCADAAASDPFGRLWLVSDYRVQPILWRYTP